MRKILVILPYFYPVNNQRGHRWRQIATFWQAKGIAVHVLTAKHSDFAVESEIEGVKVFRTGHAALKNIFYYFFNIKNRRGEKKSKSEKGLTLGTKSGRILQWWNDIFWKKIYFPDDTCVWYFSARKKALQLHQKEQYDTVISVGLPFTTHCVGLYLKSKYPSLYWLVDYGDPFSLQKEVPLNNIFWYKNLNFRLENKVVTLANAVSVTTEATRQLYLDAFALPSEKVSVIPPLLSNSKVFYRKQNADNQLIIAYFGSFYAGIREPYAILDLVKKIVLEEPSWEKKLEVRIYGDVFDQFKSVLAACDNIKICGLLDREEVAAEMQTVDFLLNISNSTPYQLPSKAPDYMQSGKPVVNIYSHESDCFKAFFADYPLIFNWKNDDNLINLIDFLSKNKNNHCEESEIEFLLKPFQLGAVAEKYWELLGVKNSFISE